MSISVGRNINFLAKALPTLFDIFNIRQQYVRILFKLYDV